MCKERCRRRGFGSRERKHRAQRGWVLKVNVRLSPKQPTCQRTDRQAALDQQEQRDRYLVWARTQLATHPSPFRRNAIVRSHIVCQDSLRTSSRARPASTSEAQVVASDIEHTLTTIA